MKKRLLITSIVMMLVVAVALSTATYAWFTSNTTVEASNITLTANTSDAAAFGISWTDSGYSSALDDVAAPATFNPLVPATYAVSTTTTAVRFATATIKQEGGAEKYNGDVKWWDTTEEASTEEHPAAYNTAAKPYIWNDGVGGHSSFYIKNLSTSIGQDHLYVYATVTGVASELVRIAIFDEGDLVGILGYKYTYTAVPTTETPEFSGTTQYFKAVRDGYLLDSTVTSENYSAKVEAGLYTRTEALSVTPVYYGTVAAGENVLTTNTNSVKSIDLGRFEALESREITVYVWLDGKYLNDDTQGTGANIALHFDAAAPTV